MTLSFVMQKFFSFMMTYLLIVNFSACANGVLFKKFLPVLMRTTLSPVRFSICGFTFGISFIGVKFCAGW